MAQKKYRVNNQVSGSLILCISAFFVFLSLVLALVFMQPASTRVADTDEGTTQQEPIKEPQSDMTDAMPAITAALRNPETSSAITVPQNIQKPRKNKTKGTLIFVIDDAGHNLFQLEPFLKFPGPLTIAVLPRQPHSTEAARLVQEARKELILHQPMEAINNLDAGEGSISADMSEDIIRKTIRDNLAQIRGAVGMNNHMGSKATADVRTMSIVLDEARANGLYFLDSLTISDSVVHSVALLMKQPAWERTVFLDNSPDRASIIKYINEGTKIAEKRGYAVMIGHVWSAELAQTLSDLYPGLIEQGFSLSTISHFMMGNFDEDIGD